MTAPITVAAPVPHIPHSVAPPPEVAVSAHTATGPKAVQPVAASAAGTRGQQQAALNRMMVKYAYEQSRGTDPTILATLGKQILDAAKAIGQHVALPHAPANATASTTREAAKVNVTA